MTDRDLRPDHEMEGRVNAWLTDTGLSPDEADAGLDRLLDEFPVTPQARRRFLGRWLERDEGVGRHTAGHDHPPDQTRRTTLMLSATGVTAALAILALTVNVIHTEPAPPNAGSGATHVVAADGSGDFTTIQAAVDGAADGDTISIQPGTYEESVIIDKDLVLTGDGPREDIVITAPTDAPAATVGKSSFYGYPETYAVLMRDSNGVITGVTFTGADTTVVIEGGAPMLSGLVFDDAGIPWSNAVDEDGQSAVLVQAGSSASIIDNTLAGGAGIVIADRSSPIIERNVLTAGATITGAPGDGTVIRDNAISDAPSYAIYLSDPSAVTIERNVIQGAGGAAIQAASAVDHEPTIMDNSVSGARFGIQVSGGLPDGTSVPAGGAPVISGNDVSAELVGISTGESDAVVLDNTVRDAINGIVASGGGTADISGNTIDAVSSGIEVGANSSAMVEGNTICGASESIKVHDTATPTIGENATC